MSRLSPCLMGMNRTILFMLFVFVDRDVEQVAATNGGCSVRSPFGFKLDVWFYVHCVSPPPSQSAALGGFRRFESIVCLFDFIIQPFR